MADSMLEGIVRIASGTGFVVTEDALVVTCAHVVEGLQVGDETQVAFHATGEIVTARLEILGETEDVAILRLDEPLPEVIKPLQLGSSMTAKDRTFDTFGFPNAKPIEGMAGKCEVVGETTQNSFSVLQLRASEITAGYSGAPVWDARLCVVIGMVTSVAIQDALGKQQETAFAIPVETLRDVCPELRIQNTCPYRGLAAFTEADAAFFFGRESLITELSDKVRRQRFVAVVGPSGSGKSSVVQAGLLPKLPRNWQVIKLRPGSDPYTSVDLSGFMQSDRSDVPRLVLFIDQFEELFALCPLDVQTRFLDDLQALIASPTPVTVILTLRADFFGHLQTSPLGKHLEHALVNVLPMEPADLRAAIARPAQAVGLRFEAGLMETIIEDARQARHTLPLLQFALTQLWNQQTQGTLTYDAYVASGRVAGAIGLWAEDTYNGLTTEEQRLARRIFTRLVHYSEGDAADTRQCRTLPELLAQPDEHDVLHRLLQRLADKRLLTTDEAQGVESVEIIHDALLKEWQRLEQWLTEQREFYLWRQRLETQLHLWEDKDRDDSALSRGALLIEAERWLQEKPEELNNQEQTYIRAGIDGREHERQAQDLRRRRILVGAVTAAVLLLVLAVIAGMGWRSSAMKELARATAQAEAENAQVAAEGERDRAERQVQIALARQLGSQAQYLLDNLPAQLPRALLLALESLRRYPEETANEVIVEGMALLPYEVSRMVHDDSVSTVAFSPDGQWIASGSADGTARVWEAATGREVARVIHGEYVSAVAFSPDGRWVVSGSWDDTARVWEAATGREIARVTHGDDVKSVTFSPNGRWVVSGGSDGTARVWEAETGREIAHVTHIYWIQDLDFSPDGQWVVSGAWDGKVWVWEAATGREISSVTHQGWVSDVAFSPDGRWVVSGGQDGTARVWEAATGREITRMTHQEQVNVATFSPSGQWVISAGCDEYYEGVCVGGLAQVWEAATGRKVASVAHQSYIDTAIFSPDGHWVVSAGCGKNYGPRCYGVAQVWEVATGREIARITHQGGIQSVAFSPDGQWVVSGSADGTARVWDLKASGEAATVRQIAYITHKGIVEHLDFSSDGKMVISGSRDGTVKVWEAATGRESAHITHEGVVSAVAFSPDSQWVVSGSADDTVRVWEATTGREIARIRHEGVVEAVAFSPDGRWVVSGGDVTARVWEATTGYEIARMTYRISVEDVAFSQNGQWVASVGCDMTAEGCIRGLAQVWEAATGREIAHLEYEGNTRSVAFSPDGQWVLSSNSDTALVWKSVTGHEISHVTHEAFVSAVAFGGSNGKWVVSAGGLDGIVQVWELVD
ncbi:MAG TPA: trypsin-like peptidase domain-containing protein [Anaerolineae bacterium]|nr:trypsin-like peptidase domain-containing protein [Anaerolineae bacterium]